MSSDGGSVYDGAMDVMYMTVGNGCSVYDSGNGGSVYESGE